MTIIDLFSGPRGWDVGLRMLGREDSIGIEIDPVANMTAAANGFRFVEGDVSAIDPHEYDGADVIGSPVCTPFTVAGAGKGREDLTDILAVVHNVALGWPIDGELEELRPLCSDPLSPLSLEPLRWVLAIRPERFAFEQVPQVLPLWDACAEVLRRKGYDVKTGVLHAEQYGVPQTRRRAVMIGSRIDRVEMPKPTHSRYYPRDPSRLDPDVLPWVSMAEALGQGMTHRPSMTVTAGGSNTGGSEPFGNGARKGMLREMQAGRWLPRAANAGTTEEDMAWAFRRPSPTIVGSFAPDVVAAPGYRKAGDGPRQNAVGSIRVTAREAAILQSFPPDYVWCGRAGKVYQQIGNAVPPLLSRHILHALGLSVSSGTVEP